MGARELLSELTAAGISLMANGQRIEAWPASRLTGELRESLRALKADLLIELNRHRRPYRLTRPGADLAHADPWDDATIARFQARASHIRQFGFSQDDADDLAEQLHLRDVHSDYRTLCIECKNYRLNHCRNHQAAGLASPEAGRDVAMLLQRCPGFQPAR